MTPRRSAILKSGRRSIDRIERGTTIAAKGHAYTIGELLADDAEAERFVGGDATTIYLHPRDYHRVHCPCDAVARRVTTVPGRLLPVTDAAMAREPMLFARNERLIHHLETPHGAMAGVMVAAFGVGHMSCAYREVLVHPRQIQRVLCEAEIVELVLHVALNTLTNYVNSVATTVVDFPATSPARAA